MFPSESWFGRYCVVVYIRSRVTWSRLHGSDQMPHSLQHMLSKNRSVHYLTIINLLTLNCSLIIRQRRIIVLVLHENAPKINRHAITRV